MRCPWSVRSFFQRGPVCQIFVCLVCLTLAFFLCSLIISVQWGQNKYYWVAGRSPMLRFGAQVVSGTCITILNSSLVQQNIWWCKTASCKSEGKQTLTHWPDKKLSTTCRRNFPVNIHLGKQRKGDFFCTNFRLQPKWWLCQVRNYLYIGNSIILILDESFVEAEMLKVFWPAVFVPPSPTTLLIAAAVCIS